MENTFFSLLYPSKELWEASVLKGSRPNISEDVCDELGLTDILELSNSSLSDFFTVEPEVIEYRQRTFGDLEEISELEEVLSKVVPILCDILELRRLSDDMRSYSDSYLYSITEIELYTKAVDILSESLAAVKSRLKSPAFIRLADIIETLSGSEDYLRLCEDLKGLASRVREIKSVTVGVNLDAQMRPTKAGIISVNAKPFTSGKMLDKILRMSFRNDAFTCISELSPYDTDVSENQREAQIGAFKKSFEEIFKRSMADFRRICGEYVLDNTDFLLKILPEIEFVSKCSSLISSLTEKGYALIYPTVAASREKAFTAKGLYNPHVALSIEERVIENDFEFDDEGRIFVLSGPNRGGKSVITCAVGLAQAMMQLGLPVPARAARISVCDGIFTHFPEGAEDTIDKGRLGEECARLKEIFDEITDSSMILLDESLSSTGAYEASYIASEILSAFATAGCRGIFSTHLHELASHIDEINSISSENGGVKLDTLVAGIEEGVRSFEIVRRKPDGKSYATDIARKYGLSFDILKNKLKK